MSSDDRLTMDAMAGYATNPSVYGTVVVSLLGCEMGCENCRMNLVANAQQTKAVHANNMENIKKYRREIDHWMDIYSIGTPLIPVVKCGL